LWPNIILFEPNGRVLAGFGSFFLSRFGSLLMRVMFADKLSNISFRIIFLSNNIITCILHIRIDQIQQYFKDDAPLKKNKFLISF